MTGGTAAALPGIAAELTGSFHRKADAGAPLCPGAVRPRQRLPHKRKGAAPFAFTLSADDTVRTKPHPDPYRAAATRFGVPASACVAVEDSPDGTASAHAAGCAVLVVPSLLPVDPARGRTFARSLEEVDLGMFSDCLRRPEASGS